MSEAAKGLVRVATYNIHRCRGLDGRTRPDRIAEVLQGIGADVIALQGDRRRRVARGPGAGDQRGARHGRRSWPPRGSSAATPTATSCSAASPSCTTCATTCRKTCELRGRQRVDVDVEGRSLHIYNVHFGTAILERRVQAERLAAIVCDRRVAGPKVVLGDFNEWTRGPASALLSERLNGVDLAAHLRRRRTYPGVLPLVHLDHIYYTGRVEVEGVELVRTRRALIASDHLPLVATLRVGS